MKLHWARRGQWPNALALLALGFVTTNAALAASTVLYYELKPPTHFLPPWKDPEILQLGLLFLLSPISMILGVVAGVRGAPKWLVCIVEVASVPLLIVGIMASNAV
jgi:hypothetical protein